MKYLIPEGSVLARQSGRVLASIEIKECDKVGCRLAANTILIDEFKKTTYHLCENHGWAMFDEEGEIVDY